VQAQNLQQSAFPTAAAPGAIVVLERADGGKLTAADSSLVDIIAGKLTADRIPTLSTMTAGAPSPNKLIQTISIQIPNASGNLTTAQTNAIGTLRSDLSSLVSGTDLKAGVTGTVAENVDSASTGSNAQKIVLIGTILLIVVLLLLIFRSPIIVLLPLLTIGLVSSVANGLIDFLSKALGWSAESFTSILLIVVLFGVGTDYILFLLFRYRERLRAGEPSKQAMESAIARVGPAIATAAGAVMIAFLALTLSSLSLFRELGPALAIAVFSAATAGLTLVPAVVSLLGTRVFWPSKAWKTEPKSARFAAIGRTLGRHPGRFAGTIVVLLGALGIVAFGFHPTFDLTSGNTATTQSAEYANVLLKGFPAGDSEPTAVLVQSTDGKQLDTASLASFGARLAKVPGVASVSPAKVNASGDVADYTVILSSSGESAAAMNTVRGPLSTVTSTDAPPGSRALVGGITSVYVDLESAMEHDYSIVFPVAAVLILIILGLLLQSVVAPWYLMVFVGLGFAATLGASVGIFQDLGNQSGLSFVLPIMMYLFVVALGTDYNILMVSRLREEATEGKTPREAAAEALRHAGPTIASAGLILAGTFASLILAGGSTFQQMGFAISCGIAIAAFVMAMFLTPAVTALLGARAWWPGHQNRGRHSRHGGKTAGDDLPSGLDAARGGRA
jgi:RND superfamily putative drug exporter